MNIAVLIKQVPVSNDVSVDPETHALVRASSEGMINPADLNAIEEAMQLKEQTDGKVVVFTMGPPDAEKALRDAMALGCDESCLITDRAVAGGDTVATAKVLAKAIQLYGEFDLILGGALSADGATGQVAAMVAEELNLPHVVEIQSVKYKEDQAGKVEVVKKMHDTSFRIACVTPAVLSETLVAMSQDLQHLEVNVRQNQNHLLPIQMLNLDLQQRKLESRDHRKLLLIPSSRRQREVLRCLQVHRQNLQNSFMT